MYLKKRKYVIVVLAGLIALAVYLNVVYTDTDGMFEITETVSQASSATLGESAAVSANGAGSDSVTGAGQNDENGSHLQTAAQEGTDSGMSQARLSRQKSRDEAAQVLKSVTENESLSADDKSEAANKLTTMAAAIEQEAAVENLVRAKGFADCVAYISDGKITLTIKADGLEKNQIAQIKDIIITQTGIGADKIKILEIK